MSKHARVFVFLAGAAAVALVLVCLGGRTSVVTQAVGGNSHDGADVGDVQTQPGLLGVNGPQAQSPIEADVPQKSQVQSTSQGKSLTDELPQAAADAHVERIEKIFAHVAGTTERTLPSDALDVLRDRMKGDPVHIELPALSIQGVVDSVLRRDGAEDYGITLNDGLGRAVMALHRDRSSKAYVFFNGDTRVLALSRPSASHAWQISETTVSDVVCAPPGATYPLSAAEPMPKDPAQASPVVAAAELSLENAVPILNSLPGAAYVIYCDFDGETVTHPWWNGGKTINALPHPKAHDVSWVTAVWRRVAEDFIPFNVNVTTDRSVYDAADSGKRMHCIITPTDTAMPGSGGVAYVGSFPYDVPCWVFNPSEYSAAETIAHEVGHTLGLSHDGRTVDNDTYYGGHGTGETSWAPIMGAAWSDAGTLQFDNVTQWSRGEYPDANNKEDDLAIIAGANNGFGYRPDDKGSTLASAATLNVSGSSILDSGIIGRTTDTDWFRFSTAGGSVLIIVDSLDVESTEGEGGSATYGANLAVELSLYNTSGSLLETSSPATFLGASITRTLSDGTYYLRIAGAARGTPATAFSNYASLGQYTITGTIPASTAGGVYPIVDNTQAEVSSGWTTSAWAPGYSGANYLHDNNAGKGTKTVTYRPNLPASGKYNIYMWWPLEQSAYPWATNVPVDLVGSVGTTTVTVNQRAGGGDWVWIGNTAFAAGTTGYVRIRTTGTSGYVIADAIKFEPGDPPHPSSTEVIVDHPAVALSTGWTVSTWAPGYAGANYLHDGSASKGTKTATYRPNLSASGKYNVYLWWPAEQPQYPWANNVPVDLVGSAGTTTVTVNQRAGGGDWVWIGNTTFAAGTTGYVHIRTTGTSGYVIADAVKFEPGDPPPTATGLIVDNPAAALSTGWTVSTWAPEYSGANYLHDNNAGKGTKTATYQPNLPASGKYNVYMWWPLEQSSYPWANNVPVDLVGSVGTTTVTVNQRAGGGNWVWIGNTTFAAGTNGYVRIRTTGTSGYVIADALKFDPGDPPVMADNAAGSTSVELAGAWTTSKWAPGYYGTDYFHDNNTSKGTKSVTFRPNLPSSGSYDVYMWWPAERLQYPWASNVPVDLAGSAGTATVTVNQRQGGGAWVLIGNTTFAAGTTGYVRIRTTGTSGYVIADAVRFIRVTSVASQEDSGAVATLSEPVMTAPRFDEEAEKFWPLAWASSSLSEDYAASNLVDGDPETLWMPAPEESPWSVILDLGEPLSIRDLEILFFDEAWPNTSVVGSVNGLKWFDLGAVTNETVTCRYLSIHFWGGDGDDAVPVVRDILFGLDTE